MRVGDDPRVTGRVLLSLFVEPEIELTLTALRPAIESPLQGRLLLGLIGFRAIAAIGTDHEMPILRKAGYVSHHGVDRAQRAAGDAFV